MYVCEIGQQDIFFMIKCYFFFLLDGKIVPALFESREL